MLLKAMLTHIPHQLFAFSEVTRYQACTWDHSCSTLQREVPYLLHTRCLTLSEHLRETLSWSHAAIQLKTVYKQRYGSSTDTRHNEESGGLFSQLRWAESSRVARNTQREKRKGLVQDLFECFLYVLYVQCNLPFSTLGKHSRGVTDWYKEQGGRSLGGEHESSCSRHRPASLEAACSAVRELKGFELRRCQSLVQWTLVHITKHTGIERKMKPQAVLASCCFVTRSLGSLTNYKIILI